MPRMLQLHCKLQVFRRGISHAVEQRHVVWAAFSGICESHGHGRALMMLETNCHWFCPVFGHLKGCVCLLVNFKAAISCHWAWVVIMRIIPILDPLKCSKIPTESLEFWPKTKKKEDHNSDLAVIDLLGMLRLTFAGLTPNWATSDVDARMCHNQCHAQTTAAHNDEEEQKRYKNCCTYDRVLLCISVCVCVWECVLKHWKK